MGNACLKEIMLLIDVEANGLSTCSNRTSEFHFRAPLASTFHMPITAHFSQNMTVLASYFGSIELLVRNILDVHNLVLQRCKTKFGKF